MEIIATTLREKLPKGYSYPIGAEALSQALTGVPQYAMLSLTFNWRDTFWASKYQANVKALGRVKIIGLNSYGLDWRIHLNALPAEQSHEAREQLNSNGLTLLKLRLNAIGMNPSDGGWVAYYDLATRRCEYGDR